MAKQPGSPAGGSDDSAAESRPISVSELLARRDAAIADEERATRISEGRGRRRAGRDGAVSVSELTGEIPRITDAPQTRDPERTNDTERTKHPEGTARTRGTVEPNAPAVEPHFPRSSSPVPRRASESRPLQDSADPAGASTGFDRSVFDAPPQTRDFNSSAVAERASRSTKASDTRPAPTAQGDAGDEHSNAVTGIIPVVGDGGYGDDDVRLVEADDVDVVELEAPPTRAGRFGDIIDDDFDAYRSFAEYDEDENDSSASRRSARRNGADKRGDAKRRGGKRKLGWFGRKTKRDDHSDIEADARPGTDRPGSNDQHADDQHADDQYGNDQYGEGDLASRLATETAAFDFVENSLDVTPAADRRDDLEPSDAPDEASTPDEASVLAVGQTGESAGEEDAADDAGGTDDTATAPTAAQTVAAPAASSTTAAAFTTAPDRTTTKTDLTTDDPTTTATSGADATTSKSDGTASEKPSRADVDEGGRSPLKAWLLVIGEAILGLAVGVGLFWGFTELWRWNVYFALVLAVLVIFGIVSFTHAVRHSRDLFTTLLALGVGLIVTIGPLVLLAT